MSLNYCPKLPWENVLILAIWVWNVLNITYWKYGPEIWSWNVLNITTPRKHNLEYHDKTLHHVEVYDDKTLHDVACFSMGLG